MTDKIDDGGPAFSRAAHDGKVFSNREQAGMSLLDWFAGMAISSGKVPMPWENPRPDDGPTPEEQTRQKAYRVADAMLAERERKR